MAELEPHRWQLRARWTGGATRVYARNHAFDVGVQASLADADANASALEHLVGALAADLLAGLSAAAARRRIAIDELEANLSAELDNPLVHLGVIGETGHAGLKSVAGTVWVSGDLDQAALDELWRDMLGRAPCFQTLSRAASVDVRARLV